VRIEFTIPSLTPQGMRVLTAAAFVVVSILVLTEMGFATWLLLLAFCLMLLAIGLLWSSVTSIDEGQGISLEEALDLAAPARDEERKLAVLRGIKDLEYERGLGKVSEQDYQQLTQRYRREARGLLERLDTSEASLRQRAMDLVEQRLAGELPPVETVDQRGGQVESPAPSQPTKPVKRSAPKDPDA
jgi:hypothetical protein